MYRGTDRTLAVLGLTDVNSAVTKLLASVNQARETTKTEAARWTRRELFRAQVRRVCVLEDES